MSRIVLAFMKSKSPSALKSGAFKPSASLSAIAKSLGLHGAPSATLRISIPSRLSDSTSATIAAAKSSSWIQDARLASIWQGLRLFDRPREICGCLAIAAVDISGAQQVTVQVAVEQHRFGGEHGRIFGVTHLARAFSGSAVAGFIKKGEADGNKLFDVLLRRGLHKRFRAGSKLICFGEELAA